MDGSLAVDGRSPSLLQWRLPPRTLSNPQAAAGLQQAVPQPQPAPSGGSLLSPSRLGGSFKRSLSGIVRAFGGSTPAAADAAPPKQPEEALQKQAVAVASVPAPEPGSPAWSIAAVRQDNVAGAEPRQEPVLRRPALTIVVPPPSVGPAEGAGTPPPPSPDSPSKLAHLRQRQRQRRVMSAPPAREASPMDSGSRQPLGSGGPASPGPGSGTGTPTAGSPGPEGGAGRSPVQRPGLQALKERARTARIVRVGSAGVGEWGTDGGPSSPYSLEAVNAVFGPDRALAKRRPPLLSPPKLPVAAAAGPGSPPKASPCCGLEGCGRSEAAAACLLKLARLCCPPPGHRSPWRCPAAPPRWACSGSRAAPPLACPPAAA